MEQREHEADGRIDEQLSEPHHLWIEKETMRTLHDRAQADEETIDDVISRLLTETETVVNIQQIVEHIIKAEELDPATIEASIVSENMLDITVALPPNQMDDLAPFIGEIDKVQVEDETFDCYVGASSSPGGVRGSTIVYARDNIIRMDPVSLDEGLEQLKQDIADFKAES